MNQKNSLLQHLRKAEISQLVAFNKLGICRLSERIREIEFRGFHINRRTAKMVNQHCHTVTYTVYELAKTRRNQLLLKEVLGEKTTKQK